MSLEGDAPARVTEEQLLVADIPSHLPAPDGVQRIRNVARQRDVAYVKYRAALKRLSDHLGAEGPKAAR
jgi:hypothetical protein